MSPPLKKMKMVKESRLELLPPCILEKILGYVTELKDIHRLLAVSYTIAETAGIIILFFWRKLT